MNDCCSKRGWEGVRVVDDSIERNLGLDGFKVEVHPVSSRELGLMRMLITIENVVIVRSHAVHLFDDRRSCFHFQEGRYVTFNKSLTIQSAHVVKYGYSSLNFAETENRIRALD